MTLGMFGAVLCAVLVAQPESAQERLTEFTGKRFVYSEAAGIGREEGITRRDPSDVIKVDDTFYLWYSRVDHEKLPENRRNFAHSGYVATIWYATSQDEGHTWTEQGEALGCGKAGTFDSYAVFTPNILKADGKYYLYYTGVKPTPGNPNGLFENNAATDVTALGLAVAASPDGPFTRVQETPILATSPPVLEPNVPSAFDSYRIDDAALVVRGGKYWLYYKGRNFDHGRKGPGFTKMGVAVAESVEGPYLRQNRGEPILDKSHEVLVWPHREGVAAYASFTKTFEFAPDGLDFNSDPLHAAGLPKPIAPAAYRPDLTHPQPYGAGVRWGISMRDPSGPCPYLVRWEADLSAPPVNVYILAGQSNMQGLGKLEELPPEEAAPVKGVWLWDGESFESLKPRTTPISKREGQFGPELFFARTMAAVTPDRQTYLIKYAAGGQPLDHGWKDQHWNGDPPGPGRKNFYPGTGPEDPNEGLRYTEMMARVTAGLAWLDARDLPYVITGIVWMQGEQDSKHPISAGRYAQNLKRLTTRVQADLHIGPVPFVYGQVLPHEPVAERFTNRDAVRQSQANADHASGHPNAVSNAWMVSTDGLPVLKDAVHYTTAGQRTLGKRFARTMLRAQGAMTSAITP